MFLNQLLIAIFVAVAAATMENYPLSRRKCPQIYRPDVETEELLFPRTRLPSNQSSCCSRFMFALPNDTDYDIIATTPVVDNPQVVQYIVLVGCTNVTKDSLRYATLPCEDNRSFHYGCDTALAAWTPGNKGMCVPKEYGYRIGPNGFQYAMLQIRYNNPLQETDLWDASGVTIYYTANLRRYQAGLLRVSQIYLDIPPHQSNVNTSAVCFGQCTDRLPSSIYITEVYIDMETLGREADVYLYRDGSLVEKLASEDHYDPEIPKLHRVKPAAEMKPGDEIRIFCRYDSTDRNTTTHFGLNKTDERCTALLTYYPFQPSLGPNQTVSNCGQNEQYGYCNSAALPVPTCMANNAQLEALGRDISDGCDYSCSDTCMGYIGDLISTGCLEDNGLTIFEEYWPGLANATLHCNNTRPTPSVTTAAPGSEMSTTASEGEMSTTAPESEMSTTASENEMSTTASENEMSTTASESEMSTTASENEMSTTASEGEMSTTASEGEMSTTISG